MSAYSEDFINEVAKLVGVKHIPYLRSLTARELSSFCKDCGIPRSLETLCTERLLRPAGDKNPGVVTETRTFPKTGHVMELGYTTDDDGVHLFCVCGHDEVLYTTTPKAAVAAEARHLAEVA